MRKILSSTLFSAVVALSLNAAVVATVDGEKITDQDLENTLRQIAPNASLAQLPEDVKKRVIEDAISKKLLLKEAKASGIEKDSEYLNAISAIKENVIGEIYFNKIFNTIKVTEAEIKSAYDSNKESLKQPAQVKAKHILVKKEADAKKIISDLKKLKGKDLVKKFEELAKAQSVDKGSAQNGGELGWFGASEMVKPFADAAFALKNGEASKTPVKSDFGYHVILKEDSKAAGTIPLADVKAQIENNLKLQKFQELIKQKTDALRKKAKIEYK